MSVRIKKDLLIEISIRISFWILFLWLDQVEPFIRVIQPEEVWLYQYPVTASYITSTTLWLIVFVVPTSLLILEYISNKNRIELQEALLSLSLNYGLAGSLTQFFKIIVGRPRPDFFYRCFPDGNGSDFKKCTGNRKNIMDGRKSFPSGHAAFAFSSLFFVSLYLSAKLKIFNENGRGNSWRLCVCIAPLIVASAIAISRTCDYHHHWQDVLVGSVLGSLTAYVSYRQYFPGLRSLYCNYSYATQNLGIES